MIIVDNDEQSYKSVEIVINLTMTRDALISCLMVCEAVLLLDLKIYKFPSIIDQKLTSLQCKNLKWIDVESDSQINVCFQKCRHFKKIIRDPGLEAFRLCEFTDIISNAHGLLRQIIISEYGNPICILQFRKSQKCSLFCARTISFRKSKHNLHKTRQLFYRIGPLQNALKKQDQIIIQPYESSNKDFPLQNNSSCSNNTTEISSAEKEEFKSISIIIPSFMIIGMASIIVLTVCCVLHQTKNDTSEKIFFSVKIQNLNQDSKFNVRFILSKPVTELA